MWLPVLTQDGVPASTADLVRLWLCQPRAAPDSALNLRSGSRELHHTDSAFHLNIARPRVSNVNKV
jgi:hypothetical protein